MGACVFDTLLNKWRGGAGLCVNCHLDSGLTSEFANCSAQEQWYPHFINENTEAGDLKKPIWNALS